MVGLPARGKSFISKKIERFLSWRGDEVQIFNVGERRRKHESVRLCRLKSGDFAPSAAQNPSGDRYPAPPA